MSRRRRRVMAGFAFPAMAVLAIRWFAPDPASIPRHLFFKNAPTPLNIAHRGASAEQAEHSWEAYDLALAQGADVLELDIRLTKDDVLVVAHDRDLRRTVGVAVAIATSTMEDLQRIAGAKAPLRLVEVLARYDVRLNIEIKEDRLDVADHLVELVRSTGRQRSVLVASYHANVLQRFRDLSRGDVATSAHAREGMIFVAAYLLGIPVTPAYTALQIPRRVGFIDLACPGFMAFAHQHGLAVHFWTIDDAAEMRELLVAGADGIMTNYPKRLEAALKAHQNGT